MKKVISIADETTLRSLNNPKHPVKPWLSDCKYAIEKGDGHFIAAEKKWCGHFSADIIGQFSAVYLYDYVRIT